MGNCCCAGSSSAVRRDAEAVNRLPPYHDYSELTRREVEEGDVTGVARDFPRVRCVVGEQDEREPFDPADFGARNRVVRTTVGTIAELCGEVDVRERFFAAWPSHVGRDTVDLSHPMIDIFVDSQMLLEPPLTPTNEEERTSPGSRRKRHPYVSNCDTVALLRYFPQGVLFYGSQRIRHQLWFPWADKMQDVDWIARVFKKDEIDPRHLFVRHAQTTTNYVDPDEIAHTPKFEVDWVLDLVADSSNHMAPIDCTIEVTAVRVLQQSGLCRSATWKARLEKLLERSFATFGLECELVEKLKTHRH